jgi:hypothetical protein
MQRDPAAITEKAKGIMAGGRTPLMYLIDNCIGKRVLELARYILEKEPNAAYQKTNLGFTPLERLVCGRNEDKVSMALLRLLLNAAPELAPRALLTCGMTEVKSLVDVSHKRRFKSLLEAAIDRDADAALDVAPPRRAPRLLSLPQLGPGHGRTRQPRPRGAGGRGANQAGREVLDRPRADDPAEKMSSGIDSCTVFCAFRKVSDDNCKVEFRYGRRRKQVKNIIAAVMEPQASRATGEVLWASTSATKSMWRCGMIPRSRRASTS